MKVQHVSAVMTTVLTPWTPVDTPVMRCVKFVVGMVSANLVLYYPLGVTVTMVTMEATASIKMNLSVLVMNRA